MKHFKNAAYATVGLSLLAVNNVSAIDLKSGSSATKLSNNQTGLVATIETWISLLVGLLYFVAVVYGIWGGFQILTAGGDEEKVKKGRTTLINALIGIAVILVASIFIDFVIGLFGTGNVTG